MKCGRYSPLKHARGRAGSGVTSKGPRLGLERAKTQRKDKNLGLERTGQERDRKRSRGYATTGKLSLACMGSIFLDRSKTAADRSELGVRTSPASRSEGRVVNNRHL